MTSPRESQFIVLQQGFSPAGICMEAPGAFVRLLVLGFSRIAATNASPPPANVELEN